MENISKVLESGNSEEKIKVLEKLDTVDSPEILENIIAKLDDDDIKVRGEAFSSLVLNKNKISNFLIKNLNSASKNIRGYASLVLANRNDTNAIPEIIKLANDERSMVRSCAIGALGHLKAVEAKEIILKSMFDSNVEVKKSALQSVIHLKISVTDEEMKKINTENDVEVEKLLSQIKKK